MASFATRLANAARAAVDALFLRHRVRLGLVKAPTGDKAIQISVNAQHTLPGFLETAAKEYSVKLRPALVNETKKAATAYLDAQAKAAKAAVGRIVHHLVEAHQEKGPQAVKDEVGKALARVFERVTGAVEKITATEFIAARNLVGSEAITVMNASAGIDDPMVFWVTSKDSKVCSECTSLFLLPDGVTPRVWRMSEVSRTYHVRGEDRPSTLGTHPFCRCDMTTILPGYGFDSGGYVKYIGPGHNEYERQRGLAKAERLLLPACDHEH